jgi:regulator of protease activity HflC (stomatin/prohibitin superfamily)
MNFLYIVSAVVIIALLWFFRANRIRRITIFEFQRGLKYRKGRFEKVLEPGQYWILQPSTAVTLVDVRPMFVSLVGQEVLTKDGAPLKVSVAASYEVSDPAKAVNQQANFTQALYLVIQLAVREVISGSEIDALIENRAGFAEKLRTLAEPSVSALGLRLISADLKDVMVAGELKKSFGQIVKARKEGQAALERARGETAALRNLANAARMVEESPQLMQLRMLQVVGESSGNTFVVGVPGSAPIPIRDGEKRPSPKQIEEGEQEI